MRVFADLEFSLLTNDAELISIGAISEDGACFYMEVATLPTNCSAFVHAEVLPHLSRKDCAITVQEIEFEFAAWLSQWVETKIVVDSEWDCFVLRKTFSLENSFQPGVLRLKLRSGGWLDAEMTLDDAFEVFCFEAYLTAKRSIESAQGFRKHHALDDAKALRAAVLAAEAA